MTTRADANRTVVLRFFEGWTNGAFEEVRQLFELDAPWWILGTRKTYTSRERLETHETTCGETVDGMRWIVRSTTSEGDRVSVEVESHADFPGRGHYNNLYHFLFRVVDGKIVEVRNYYDTALTNRVMHGVGTDLGPLESHRD